MTALTSPLDSVASSLHSYAWVAGFGRVPSGPSEELRCRDDEIERLRKTAEDAQILGVSQNTLRLWAEAGKIPVHRNPANGYRLFKRLDLEKFLQKVERPAKRSL